MQSENGGGRLILREKLIAKHKIVMKQYENGRKKVDFKVEKRVEGKRSN